MQRTGRLFELMILFNRQTRFTVQELADQFGVSRRTMLRDLQLLSEMGVPLQSSPGVHGGYTVMRAQQLPPISLTTGEAIGLLMSYETLQAFPEGPFYDNHLSVITKLRSVLPQEVIQEVDEYRERVTIEVPRRQYTAPYLEAILQASKDGVHVEIEYESGSGRSTRIIYPYGLIAWEGFWYCPSYCYKRKEHVRFRVDRILHAERRADFQGEAPTLTLQDIMDKKHEGELPLLLRAELTLRGYNMSEWHPQMSRYLHRRADGTAWMETKVALSDLQIFAHFFLGLGQEVRVEAPAELVAYMREQVQAMRELYFVDSQKQS
jgi:predicted DNA-binding transcriptional regulator YafY